MRLITQLNILVEVDMIKENDRDVPKEQVMQELVNIGFTIKQLEVMVKLMYQAQEVV